MGWMGASWLKRHLCAPFVLSLRQRWWESGDWRSTRLRANWEMKWVPGWVRTNLERVEKKNNDEKSFWPNTSTDQLLMNNKTTKPKKQINQILFSRVIIIVIRSLFVQSSPILRRHITLLGEVRGAIYHPVGRQRASHHPGGCLGTHGWPNWPLIKRRPRKCGASQHHHLPS